MSWSEHVGFELASILRKYPIALIYLPIHVLTDDGWWEAKKERYRNFCCFAKYHSFCHSKFLVNCAPLSSRTLYTLR